MATEKTPLGEDPGAEKLLQHFGSFKAEERRGGGQWRESRGFLRKNSFVSLFCLRKVVFKEQKKKGLRISKSII